MESDEPFLGLVMIVKDEEAIIERCLTFALHYCDNFTILDTGSTDDTRKIIWRIVRKRKINGKSVRDENWEGFGPALNMAFEWAREQGSRWLIRLDADMVMKVSETWIEDLLSVPDDIDFLLVPVKDAGQVYYLPLLVRGDQEWEYVGKTHEYLSTGNKRYAKFDGIQIIHLHDGGNRDTKFVRDLALLAEGVEANDERAIFYSAQSYEGLGADEKAIELYERRMRMGGFEEERWYASYKAAALKRDVDALLVCHRHRPWRCEPLLVAARILAENGPGDDILFLDNQVLTDVRARMVA